MRTLVLSVLLINLIAVGLVTYLLALERDSETEAARIATANLSTSLEKEIGGLIDKIDLTLLTVGITMAFGLASLIAARVIFRGWVGLDRSNRTIDRMRRQFELVLESAGDGICGVDLEGRVIFSNGAARRLLGWTEDPGPDENLHQLSHHHHPDGTVYDQNDCAIFKTLRDGEPRQVTDDVYWRRDGSSFPVENCATAIRENEEIVGAVNVFRDITVRRRLEEELRRSEERFRTLVEGTTDWIWETDAEHRFSWASGTFERITGHSSADFLCGKRRWDLAAQGGDIDSPVWQRHRQDLDNHRSFRDFRYWIRSATGELLWISVNGMPRFDGRGRFIGYRGSASDITDRARDAQRLKMLSTVVEQSPVSVIVTDRDGCIDYVNLHFTIASGYTADEVIGKNCRIFASGDTAPAVYRDLWDTIRAGRRWTGELLNRRKDGEPHWEMLVIAPVLGEDGQVANFVALKQDITERKRSEERVRHLLAYRHAVQANAPVGLAVFDGDRRCIEANETFVRIFGIEGDGLPGKSSRVLYRDDEQFDDIGRRAYPLILSGEVFSEEIPMRRLDGTDILVRTMGRLVDPQAPVLGVIWTMEDVTEKRALEQSLKRSNAELEQFAYVASHDLRQPLRMVTSYLTLIERRLGPDAGDEIRKFIDYAVSGARRMDRLILDLLDYSRAGRAAEMGPVALADAVAEALANLTTAVAEADAEIVIAEGLPTVTGDPTELARLFQNLIGNAVKYRAPDRRPRIEIGCSGKGREWLLWVRDNGIGIKPQDRERAFALFQRLVPVGSYEGTGIGLAVCRKIAQHHGGRIWIESELGEGSTFFMTFPMASIGARKAA